MALALKVKSLLTSLQRSLRSPSWITESLLLREGDGKGVEEYGMGRGGRMRERGREGREGRGREEKGGREGKSR